MTTEWQDPLAALANWPTEEQRRAQRRGEIVTQTLAESTAADVAVLRQALAEIVALEDGVKSFGGGCICGNDTLSAKKRKQGITSCKGHVPEVLVVARKALGLPPIPDTARVEEGE